jgi:type I restriction enzyme S subunit
MRGELPRGWASAPLSDLGSWLGGGTPSKAVPEFWTGGTIPWVSPKDMKRLVIDSAQDQITEAAVTGSATNLVPARSVLMVTRSGILEHTFPVAVNAVPVTINQDLKAWTARGVDSLYAAYYLRSRQQDVLRDCSKDGTTVSSIEFDQLAKFPMLVAPLAEQQRIVSRIEELFSEIDVGERALERVGRLVERYRQSVLKAAVTGELTREWRGGVPGDGGDLVVAEDGPLPVGWKWRSLDDLCWATSYGTSAKCAAERAGVPVLRIPNVRGGRIDLLDLKWAPADLELTTDDLLSPGDLLVVRTNGSESLIGVGAVVLQPLPEPIYFASYLIRFRLKPEPYLAEWVNLVWQSDVVRRFVHEHKATSAGQYNISQSKLRALRLPVPPEPERKQLLDVWQTVSSRVAATLRDVAAGRQGALALRQSILKTAFSGQLVPQDPRDEPASALLARLAAQASAAPPAPKRRGRPPRQAAAPA